MAVDGVHLRDLGTSFDRALLEELYAAVLAAYFAPGELVPLDALAEGLQADPRETDVVVAIDDDGTVIGGAVGDWDGDSGVYLLSYLAVRSTLRSRGLGTTLMEHVRSWWEDRGADLVLAEVDDPRHHEVSEYGDPAARLRFYERIGARVLDVPYTQPEVRPGSGRVPGMLLISFVVQGPARQDDGLSVEVLTRFLANYLELSEGVPAEQLEEEVHVLVPALRDRTNAVAILPMQRYIEI
jgi:GNAT superfamily N-acetyltransferase